MAICNRADFWLARFQPTKKAADEAAALRPNLVSSGPSLALTLFFPILR
jgi:hypothetical protein